MPTTFRSGQFPQSVLLRGIHDVIGWNFTQRPAIGRQLFNVYESEQAREHTLTMGAGGLFRERAEGASTEYGTFNEGFLETFTPTTFSDGFRLTQWMYLNDMYGTMERLGAELGRMAAVSDETILANVLNNGFTSTYAGYDGVELFDVAHVRENGDIWRNKPATGEDADLSQTSLEQGLIDFSDQRDGGGKRLSIKPVCLLTARNEWFNGWRYMSSDKSPENDTNAMNPLAELGLKHVVWDYLDTPKAWFLLADKQEHDLRVFDRIYFYSDHIYDFDTDDIKYKGVFSMSAGWGDARGVWGTSGT